jgi:hypothetical protein
MTISSHARRMHDHLRSGRTPRQTKTGPSGRITRQGTGFSLLAKWPRVALASRFTEQPCRRRDPLCGDVALAGGVSLRLLAQLVRFVAVFGGRGNVLLGFRMMAKAVLVGRFMMMMFGGRMMAGRLKMGCNCRMTGCERRHGGFLLD